MLIAYLLPHDVKDLHLLILAERYDSAITHLHPRRRLLQARGQRSCNHEVLIRQLLSLGGATRIIS